MSSQAQLTQDRLLIVHNALTETFNDPLVSTEGLASTVSKLISWMDTQFGVKSVAPHKRLHTKLPGSIFRDYRPHGALYTVLKACYEFKLERGYEGSTKLELSFLPAEGSEAENLSLFQFIVDQLEVGGFIPHPRVWFEGLESSRQQALTQIVLEHKGSVANSAGEATHFVFPDTSLEQVEEQKYFRVVERYGDKALLHWWYFPDSYDVWTPATQEHETQAVVTQKPWRVTSRWITDTDKFNEWMNENDYLYDEVVETPARQSRKRHISDLGLSPDALSELLHPKKRGRVETGVKTHTTTTQTNTTPDVTLHYQDAMQTTIKQLAYKRTPRDPMHGSDKAWHVSNIPSGDGISFNHPALTFAASHSDILGVVANPSEPAENVLPKHSAEWFQMDAIHALEQRALPEFFTGRTPSKTPAIYKEYRDFMIHAYQQNPSVYLTVTACRRNLHGDACAIIRVHDFLCHWGLINYMVNPDITQLSVPAPVPDPSQPIQQIFRLSRVPAKIYPAYINNTAAPNQGKYICYATQKPITGARYHCLRQPDINLSVEAFNKGMYPPDMFSSDFKRVEDTYAVSYASFRIVAKQIRDWSDEETLRLLKGIEALGESWTEVAEFVGTRDPQECLKRFLLIEPSIDVDQPHAAAPEILGDLHTRSSTHAPHGPFSGTTNPLMSLLGFLTAVVSPDVAASASQAALKTFMEAKESREKEMEVETKAPTSEDMKAASAAALSAAALKAQVLALREEREIEKLVLRVIELQVQKIQLKMANFSNLEKMLDEEQRKIEQAKQMLAAEKLKFEEQKIQPPAVNMGMNPQ